ncbi:MAG: Diacetyl reductase [(S)-acetoin forming] [Burkholderia gladioli]|nr:MAG: Diacetyl reductase [(S)-acetoin forming] [Burkholderia gladioli]
MQKTWLITGTSAGLDRLLTEKALQRGDRVAAALRREGALDALQAQYGERLLTLRAAVDRAFAAFGRIDVAVGNAAYGLFGAVEEATDAQIDRQIATNITGSIQFVRAVLPHLRRQGGGRIVQVSSEGGQIAYPGFSLYHATKWGIEGFLESVAQEVKPFGIDVLIVEPGPTRTQFCASLDRTEPMPCYDATPVGEIRRAIASGAFNEYGDAERTVDAMLPAIDAV